MKIEKIRIKLDTNTELVIMMESIIETVDNTFEQIVNNKQCIENAWIETQNRHGIMCEDINIDNLTNSYKTEDNVLDIEFKNGISIKLNQETVDATSYTTGLGILYGFIGISIPENNIHDVNVTINDINNELQEVTFDNFIKLIRMSSEFKNMATYARGYGKINNYKNYSEEIKDNLIMELRKYAEDNSYYIQFTIKEFIVNYKNFKDINN